jgi:hypothetical protein
LLSFCRLRCELILATRKQLDRNFYALPLEGYKITGRKRNLAGSAHMAIIHVPTTLEEALASKQAELWQQAADDEMASLLANGTWELEVLPAGVKPIPVKWVFKVKRDASGNVERFKARLVAKGFRQREGIDYEEVVSKYVTVRALLALLYRTV